MSIMRFTCFFITVLLQNYEFMAMSVYPTKIQWVSVMEGEVLMAYQHPDGKEDSVFMYICRIERDGGRYPGKYYAPKNKYPICFTGFYGNQVGNQEFEVLSVPPGSTSWIRNNDGFPKNAIAAGYTKDGTTLYICRGWLNSEQKHLITGYAITNTRCYVPFHDEKRLEDFEVLVRNEYGILINA